jgi:hypothetical protein
MLKDQVVESLQIIFFATFQNNQMNYTNLPNHDTTRNFGFCNCRMQLKFSCMRHMQLQICAVA